MNSSVLATIHVVVVNIFLLIYLVKTILIFTNASALEKFTKSTKVIEMIVSTLFLVTGIWLYAILGAIKFLHIIKLALVVVSIPLAVIGFKKKNKALALLSFVLILGVYAFAEMAKGKPYLPAKVVVNGNADESSITGIKTYTSNCAMCHGLDGKKKYRDALDLSESKADASRILMLIKDGSKGKMPSFSGTLSEEEVNAVSNYVITLRGK
jgi:uncharacterized membrane protein SirB2